MKQVLLVDNENTTLEHLMDGLQAFTRSWVLLSVANGKEALSLLKQHPVDLVVTKLSMPVMDGLTLLTHLRRRYPHLLVIVQSTTPAPQGDSLLQEERSTTAEYLINTTGAGHPQTLRKQRKDGLGNEQAKPNSCTSSC